MKGHPSVRGVFHGSVPPETGGDAERIGFGRGPGKVANKGSSLRREGGLCEGTPGHKKLEIAPFDVLFDGYEKIAFPQPSCVCRSACVNQTRVCRIASWQDNNNGCIDEANARQHTIVTTLSRSETTI
ncbi:CST complex subunit CTC1-like protein [Anopheles sinensis]|uniref:CST complex subunit CTC1-like protein n=1 Tax=Anopheles sinensis TaxID=74873 RepID=A0A084W4B6_ANOSI|nr:CST complex subunit CTC1-like protein [Anopheles sinensis]